MNGITYHHLLLKRALKWPVWCGLLGLLLVQTVMGQVGYTNTSVVTNPGNIDTTNFVNFSSFSANYGTPYETTHTLNYFNSGTMNSSGGFVFDTLSSGFRYMASGFYNSGSITVGSPASLIVNATNLVNPGTLDVGANGLLQLTGQNLNLTYATLTMEQGGLIASSFGLDGTGNYGTDTNADWNPGSQLTAVSATSSLPNVFTAGPAFGGGSYATYFNTVNQSPSNTIIRAIFLGNVNTNNITTKAYFDSSAVGGGFAHVEWDGVYTNPATGQTFTNYLYLSDDYVLGATTNVSLVNGIPSNFQFTLVGPNTTLTNPATAGFQPVYLPGTITNAYSYADVQLIPTSVPAGVTASNPSGAITNLPAQIKITANQELNLALATITGQNYLSLTCTNQFDGAAGAQIVSPYTDINLGVTNGNITVSNLVQSVVPNWVGTVQAWSTRWTVTATNGNVTDFRVMIVSSDIAPSTVPQIGNLTLHGTNLVISDELNIANNPNIDAQSLTLTANGAGAGSPYGELNFENSNTLFPSSFPNLLWLTNNGVINLGNAGNFGGSPAATYQAFVNNGQIFDQGSTIFSSYFKNTGIIANGSGNFFLQSQSAVLTNGYISASGDVAITSDSLMAGKVQLQAGRSLTLQVTNLLTDNGATNNWSVGASSLVGMNLPILPAAGDLHATTISVVALASKNVVSTWAGANWGVSGLGYLNNASLGGLILDARSLPPRSLLTFTGTGANNALYVGNLYLTNYAATLSSASSSATALSISPNMVIYYQQAYSNGVPVSATINGWNNNQLRWVSPAILAQTNIVVQPPSLSSSGFNYAVSGVLLPNASALTTNSSYPVIVQTATNLASPNWVNVFTGTPPFTYTDSGYTNNPQQFYRSKQGW